MLDLRFCEIKDEGGNIIFEGLKQNNTLKSMNLGNKLTNINLLLIVYLLVYIEGNKISEGLKEEFDALAKERGIEIGLEDQTVDSEDEYEDEESEEEGEVEGGEDSEDEDQDEEGREEEKDDCN